MNHWNVNGSAGQGVRPGATLVAATEQAKTRAFKTKKFSKSAAKAHLSDRDLCHTLHEVMTGQADDLGGGVFKKRLNNNEHRAIVLAKGDKLWVYEHLFAKKDTANIARDELAAFRSLAKAYAKLTQGQLTMLMDSNDLQEICHDDEEIQKRCF